MDTLTLSSDTINSYRNIIKTILADYTKIVYFNGDIENQLIIDKDENHYLVMSNGWDGKERVYHCLIGIEIKDNKIWIQHDRTPDGIGSELITAGIPSNQIVLGFMPANKRLQNSIDQ